MSTTKLPPGTRVNYLGTDKFGTVVPGIAPHAEQVIVQLDDFVELGSTHILFRSELAAVNISDTLRDAYTPAWQYEVEMGNTHLPFDAWVMRVAGLL